MQQTAKTNILPKRHVTINTDASWYWRQKIGAWALWIRCDRYFIKGSAVFKNMPKSSMGAEAQCLINALTLVKLREPDPTAIRLIINNDCLWLHQHIRGERKMRVPEIIVLVRQIRELLEGIDYEFRHVKAHTDDLGTSRSYVNDWCDRAAKAASQHAMGWDKRGEYAKSKT